MSHDPFLGEIDIFSFVFAPKNWAQCNGQLMAINQNAALFSLLGVTYGGNGMTTFGLPDLRGRIPIHMGAGHVWGERGGEEFHTLLMTEMPQHTHQLLADATTPAASNTNVPAGNTVLGQSVGHPSKGADFPVNIYSTARPDAIAARQMVGTVGGSQGHENRQPFLALNYCISLAGIYPSRN